MGVLTTKLFQCLVIGGDIIKSPMGLIGIFSFVNHYGLKGWKYGPELAVSCVLPWHAPRTRGKH